MTNTTRSRVYVPVSAMILTAALAVPAAAQRLVPLRGTFQGNDTVTGTNMVTSATGTGTHLGRFSVTQDVTLDFGNFTNTGSAHWEAANGDSIDTTVVGSAVPGNVV